MTTQQRRIVYMTKPEWEAARDWAKANGITTSAMIRNAVAGFLVSDRLFEVSPLKNTANPQRPMSQAERDAILRRVNKGG